MIWPQSRHNLQRSGFIASIDNTPNTTVRLEWSYHNETPKSKHGFALQHFQGYGFLDLCIEGAIEIYQAFLWVGMIFGFLFAWIRCPVTFPINCSSQRLFHFPRFCYMSSGSATLEPFHFDIAHCRSANWCITSVLLGQQLYVLLTSSTEASARLRLGETALDASDRARTRFIVSAATGRPGAQVLLGTARARLAISVHSLPQACLDLDILHTTILVRLRRIQLHSKSRIVVPQREI
jgi:hypothetical protein